MQPQLFTPHINPLESLGIPQSATLTLCGIDEAGRGCIAGSLFVCGVILHNTPQDILKRLKDSKKLHTKKRQSLALELQKTAQFHLVKKNANLIDAKGLSLCIKESLQEILQVLNAPFYVFDGNCRFGINSLKTLIKGDSKIKAISAASILAKYAKDCEMEALDSIYPHYNFKNNQGYGTKAHLNAIAKYGYCKEHRKSYQIKSL